MFHNDNNLLFIAMCVNLKYLPNSRFGRSVISYSGNRYIFILQKENYFSKNGNAIQRNDLNSKSQTKTKRSNNKMNPQ